jgi:hypothetical protein
MRQIDKAKLTLVGDDCARYFSSRLCEKGSCVDDLLKIKKIILYPGVNQEEFDKKMYSFNARQIEQKSSMEHIWEIEPGTLALPIFHDYTRLDRYTVGLDHLNSQGRKIFGEKFCPIEVMVEHIDGDHLQTKFAFDKLRSDWLNRVESNENILGKHNVRDVTSFCIGAYTTLKEILADSGIRFEEHSDHYLDYMFFEHDGLPVLATKNMYGDQMGKILEDLVLRQHFGGKKQQKRFDIYVLTKAGGFSEQMERGDLAAPVSCASERPLINEQSEKLFRQGAINFQNKLMQLPVMQNAESHGIYNLSEKDGINIFSGVKSLVSFSSSRQFVDVLNWAHELGCTTVEMELGSGQLKTKYLNETNPDLNISLNNFFVISDKPIDGDTLADENWDNKRFYKGRTVGYKLILDRMKQEKERLI